MPITHVCLRVYVYKRHRLRSCRPQAAERGVLSSCLSGNESPPPVARSRGEKAEKKAPQVRGLSHQYQRTSTARRAIRARLQSPPRLPNNSLNKDRNRLDITGQSVCTFSVTPPLGRPGKRYKGTWTAKSATRTHRHAPWPIFDLRILSMNLNVASH